VRREIAKFPAASEFFTANCTSGSGSALPGTGEIRPLRAMASSRLHGFGKAEERTGTEDAAQAEQLAGTTVALHSG